MKVEKDSILNHKNIKVQVLGGFSGFAGAEPTHAVIYMDGKNEPETITFINSFKGLTKEEEEEIKKFLKEKESGSN
jgi:hypothetical protein